MDSAQFEKMLSLAARAKENAYAPYSGYGVGASLVSEDGQVFLGCNVENAAYGHAICAERTALVGAVAQGVRGFSAIFVTADGSPPWPCGACRQMLSEFSPEMLVVVQKTGEPARQMRLSELLPHAFSPANVQKDGGFPGANGQTQDGRE